MKIEDLNNIGIVSLKNELTPKYFKIEDLPSLENVIDSFIDYNVDCSKFGLSTEIVTSKPLREFLQFQDRDLYVFHNIYQDKKFYEIIKKLIPPISEKKIRISRLYVGEKGSGSHIHHHSFAVNYLIEGTKLWVLFPCTTFNIEFIEKNNIDYGSLKNSKPLEWVEQNKEMLLELQGVEFKIQEAGDVFTIPRGYYHGVYNLSRVCGITYSWN